MRWAVIVLAALCAACGAEKDRPADTIIVNGKIFTGVEEAPEADALAIRDGLILAVGGAAEVRAAAGKKTVVINAGGRRIVPGLTDAHAHFGARPDGVRLDLGGGSPPDPEPQAVLKAVRAEAVRPEGKGWIYAVIGPRVLEDSSLRRTALDMASPARPVMLYAWAGHGTLLNTRGLKTLGVNEGNDPPGGWCERDASGECTGLLREMMEFAARRKLHMSVPVSETAKVYRKAAEAFLRWGVTAVHEMAISHTVERTVAVVDAAQIPVRWSIYRSPILRGSLDEAWAENYSELEMPERIRLAGVKWILDGTPLERDAARREDYADKPGWKGRLNFPQDQIRRILEEGLERGEQLALHVSGDRTLAVVLATMKAVASPEKWREHRLRVEHGDGLQPDLMESAAELGIVLVQNPLHFAPIPLVAERFGEERQAEFQPLRSPLEKGIPVALGADAGGPASNPWLNIMMAARHPRNPGEALSVRQALAAYTSGGAYAEKQEAERGTLERGKLADLAILSQDVLDVPVEKLPATHSVLTMISGEVVYRTDDIAGLPASE